MLIPSHGLQFHVEDRGEGDVIVLLHGFTGAVENWEPFIEKWSDRYRCIAVDLIGHGKSSKPDHATSYTMGAMSIYLKDILDQLNVKKANLIGYSMGGRFALSFAVKYPAYVKSLILESSSPGLETAEEREERITKDSALAKRIAESGIDEFVAFWESLPLFQSQQHLPSSVQREIRNQRLTNSTTGLINSLKGMGTGTQPSNWEQLMYLPHPMLLLVGEEDEKFIEIANRMAERLPEAIVEQINEASHTIHVEQPQIFDKMVIGFLEKLSERQN
ncbi:2-succinyl-6-hydroxy-2,4-cyclohexadiene-1-carboxylate synthase [Guptibacillus algicola]|uniref:2-succinyl-6-hydroxy-2, 4-cyclohexadiene-1-carboxylate synthase n=1 Tax=Guptibacillus algicola TaxID=225844 RepID=UPI001CD26255|nr:2-succinyl-6-hydroxy-2,4-cyclohexadiene-1-carboxylate synthase [Alkalihalobacillus algicola]MCA0986453.1 2-succinyl-6-hydroxy-2,4-cyclohexadiene-1-carboxylate synthase [Alkalihalobacillus algicola]